MKRKTNILAKLAKKVAEQTLRRDANSTTCISIYQPKVPVGLRQYKRMK